jgi:tRNA threonylcarbamoyladenosine biosynthesis protein TsaB
MLVLAIDTSGKQGSIALAQGAPDGRCEALEVVALQGGTFSAQLIPQAAALLARHGFTKRDLGALAAASGPGSFTGLRVGLAAIKALAEVLDTPIATVSLLEAVAVASGGQGKILAALDAGRNEIYTGEYELGVSATMLRERLLTQQEFLSGARGFSVVTPDAGIAQLIRSAGLPVQEIARPGSDLIAKLGWRKILAGQTVSPEALEANYIRRSDAEIFSQPERQRS